MTLTDIKYIVEFCRIHASLAVVYELTYPIRRIEQCNTCSPWDIVYDFEEEGLREVWMYSKRPGLIKGLCIWRNGVPVNERFEYND